MPLVYVPLVDWLARLGAWLGPRLQPVPLFVVYDGNCGFCRRAARFLSRLDWFGRMRMVNGLDRTALERSGIGHLDPADLARDIHAVRPDGSQWAGFAAYRTIAGRAPLLWPLWPLMWLPPVAAIGQRIYRRFADSRVCSVEDRSNADG